MEEVVVAQPVPQRLGSRTEIAVGARLDETPHSLGGCLVGLGSQVDQQLTPLGKLRSGEPGAHEGHTVASDDVVDEAVGDLDVTHPGRHSTRAKKESRHGAGSRPPFLAERSSQLRSEEHTSELQSRENLVCRLLLEKKKK